MSATQLAKNAWRLDTPGAKVDAHRPPRRPGQVLHGVGRLPRQRALRLPRQHRARVHATASPTSRSDESGNKWLDHRGQHQAPGEAGADVEDRAGAPVVRAARARPPPGVAHGGGGRAAVNASGRTVEQRLADQAPDGVDVELVFPNRGLLCWATPDPVFADADVPGLEPLGRRLLRGPTMDTASRSRCSWRSRRATWTARWPRSTWAAEHGFRGVVPRQLPASTGPTVRAALQYNDPTSSRCGRCSRRPASPSRFHVSTGRDPRAVGGNGRRHHQLRLPLDGDHDRAAGAAHHLGRVRAPPAPARRPGRERHRLRAVAARDDGLRLPGAPLLGAAGHPRAARRSTSAATASPPSRKTTPAWHRRGATTSSTTCCGPTTTRTTRARGPTRPPPSSGRWATSATSRGPRSSG